MEIKKLTDVDKNILREIGYFFLNQFNTHCHKDDYEKCHSFLKTMNITNIEVVDEEKLSISLWVERPGIFIGAMGKNVNDLKIILGEKYEKEVEFKLFENNINFYLYPTNMEDYEDDLTEWGI